MSHTEVGNKLLFGGPKTARDKFGSQPVRLWLYNPFAGAVECLAYV